ncbi:alpha/beta hydrolase [Ruegeria jejuensis]|uniref:alpha/beta hydrolase n=1 Tax=Ruegeria jejuensis TaxID=3233338 RepID=UPI00355B3032
MSFDPVKVEAEINDWFFVEYFDRWVAKGAGESEDDPEFIVQYWNNPMFVCAPPITKVWLQSDEHVALFFQAQQEQLQAFGYTHTDIPDRRITVFTADSGEIDVIWSRCAGDREIERLIVNFQVTRLVDKWKVVGVHSKYTSADTVDEAWAGPEGTGPLSASNEGRMDPSNLAPELRDALSLVPNLPFSVPAMIPVGRALYEFFTLKHPDRDVNVREVKLDDTFLRVIEPQENKSGAAVLWIHGGGLVSGRANQLNEGASKLAKMTGATVVTVNYRLAPEHPFPAAHDDCYAAWRWIQNNADALGIDPARVGLVGNSAGGGLTAALAQRILDDGAAQPVCQVLFYPMLDDRTATDTSLDDVGHYVWGNRDNRTAWNAYLAPNEAGAAELPAYASAARRENLEGLPPTWLGVGSIDLFSAEGLTYANRLKSSGVPVEVVTPEGAPHAFEAIVPTAGMSQQFVGAGLMFLAKALAPK